MTIRVYPEMIQGSDEWHAARCGLLTASEMKLIIAMEGGGAVTRYRTTGSAPTRPTPKRLQALDCIGDRIGTISELSFLANVSDGVLRDLCKDGALEAVKTIAPVTYRSISDDKERAHVCELAGQRVTGYVEPHYISDDMLRGHDDEVDATLLYAKHYHPVEQIGFITNDRFGFTIGYSPDAKLVGQNAGIENKSRRQKFQVDTICNLEVPVDYAIQLQTGLLVSEWEWLDFNSYCGGLEMVTLRVFPDPVVQNAIEEAAGECERRIAERIDRYRERQASDARLIPTERRIEQEMYV